MARPKQNQRKKPSKNIQPKENLRPKEQAVVKKQAPVKEVYNYESDENDEEEDGNFLAFNKHQEDSDEGSENEVYDLDVNNEDESDDDENDYDDDDDLERLVENLPPELRQKILNKKGDDDDDELDEDEAELLRAAADQNRWGKKKKNYYAGDTADLEIGQDFEDAVDEEEAAKELNAEKLKRMKESDFYDDFNEWNEDDEQSQDDGNKKSKKKPKKLTAKSKDIVAKQLEALEESINDSTVLDKDGEEIERISRDISSLTENQKLEIMAANSPELLVIIRELRERVDELQNRVSPVRDIAHQLKDLGKIEDELVAYLDVKQELLLCYCMNVVYYLYMKSLGKSVKSHPVMKQMLRLRYAMEKTQSMDQKLKHQVDRLLKVATTAGSSSIAESSSNGMLLKPNLQALLDAEDDEDDNSDKMDDDSQREEEVYRPPKLTSVPYPEDGEFDGKKSKKAQRQQDRQRKKLRSSEMLQTLEEEFGSRPEETASGGIASDTGDLKRMKEEEEERLRFEEDRFMRTTLTKKEKKTLERRAQAALRIDNFDDLGDASQLDELLQQPSAAKAMKSMGLSAGSLSSGSALSTANALKTALAELNMTKTKGSKKVLKDVVRDDDDYDSDDGFGMGMGDDDAADFGNARKRRRAPDMDADLYGAGDDGDADDADNPYAQILNKKAAFNAEKAAKYAPTARFGGVEQEVPEDAKRAASYEIIKNRGLTPHRNKVNRNARVKKREKYAKAVVSRKGQVRDVKTGVGSGYGGEETGIKSQLSRSRKLV